MNTLVYHPAFDLYHCAFRMLLVLDEFGNAKVETLRIIDFYLLFPELLKDVKLPRSMAKYKSMIHEIGDSFEVVSNPKRLFHELYFFQEAAIRSLIAKGVFEKSKYLEGELAITQNSLPESLRVAFENSQYKSEKWYRFLLFELGRIPLGGDSGLKFRTGLMEYRYDLV